jgi:Na+/phosphate symporter
MSLENLIIVTKNFYYSNTYLALAIGVGLALFFFFKPKEAFKTLGVVLIFLLIVYGFSILGKTSSLGMKHEKRMINQTVDRLK